jgi:TetR/AcrR family transcriptional regulator, transcriptional repressor of bet genes
MPKVVDHEQRRAELATAVWRLASRDGLEAVTVRRVAEEAGWSTGAVVHYFSDKEDLLLFAFSTVADRVRTRLVEALPIEKEQQAEVRVWFAFLGLALTRPAFARAQRLTYRAWRGRVAELLLQAQERGDLRPDVDTSAAAVALVAVVDGLSIQATFEPRAVSAKRQVELVDRQLDALRA